MANHSQENEEKVAYFQDVTGMRDASLSTQILEAHGWDLDAAVTSLVGADTSVAIDTVATEAARRWGSDNDAERDFAVPPESREEPEGFALGRQIPNSSNYERSHNASRRNSLTYDEYRGQEDPQRRRLAQPAPGIVWRLVTLPFSIVRGSYNLMYGAVGLGMWAAGGVISYSLGALGSATAGDRTQARALLSVPTGAAEASRFVENFEREYGETHLSFQHASFMEALRMAGQRFKFLFVYLHSPEHSNTPAFCERTLCSEAVVQFVNENFVVWGGDVRTSEGYQMSNTLKASTFPFCAVVTASSNQRIALLQQVEGPKTADELVAILERVVEEQGAVLVAARVEDEERQLNRRLREEQDAAFQAALQADQERERRRQEEAERAAKEAEEEEKRRRDEEEASARAKQEAAERVLSLELRRQEKAASLGLEPEKGADVTQVLVRLPNGERKDRRFYSHDRVQKVYDYVDSLGSFDAVNYTLVSNFPRTVYGPHKLELSLRDAGLHPHASLFVQVEDS